MEAQLPYLDTYEGPLVNVSKKGDYGFVRQDRIQNTSKSPRDAHGPDADIFVHVNDVVADVYDVDLTGLKNGMVVTFKIASEENGRCYAEDAQINGRIEEVKKEASKKKPKVNGKSRDPKPQPTPFVGTIRLIKGKMDFGFIRPDTIAHNGGDGTEPLPDEDVFIHCSRVEGRRRLQDGMSVAFCVMRPDEGRHAGKYQVVFAKPL